MTIILLKILLASPLLVLSCETVHRGGFKRALRWAAGNLLNFASNAALLAALAFFVTGLSGSFLISFGAAAVLYYVITCVSFFKIAARNEPLFFSDILLAFKIMGVAGASNIIINKRIIFSILTGASLLLILFLTPSGTLPVWPERLILTGASALIIVILMFQRKDDIFYEKKGLLLGLTLNICLYFKKVKPVKSTYSANVKTSLAPPDIKPNIIVVLSESFFDITRISGLRLSENPLPFFTAFKQQALSGTTLVTQIGGGTCAVEAEFLTGCVMRHFNLTKPIYYSGMKPEIPGLPRIFKEKGYETTAVHTYKKTFYNRAKAFKSMGFDRFLGLEDLSNPVKDGFYVSDSELTDMIIREYEKKNRPAFIFGISMENHQPYAPEKYKETKIKVLNENLSEKLKTEAEVYIHGLNHADRELERLVSFIEKQAEPTVLLYFGDHLGAPGLELEFYKKTGYISMEGGKLSNQDILNLYSPDFLLWSNYQAFTPDKSSRDYENIGANFLPNILLNLIGGEKPELFHVLDVLSEKLRCLSRTDITVDSSGHCHNAMPAEIAELEKMYKSTEYKYFL